MKLQYILKCLFLAMISLIVTTLEHEKSFMRQEVASTVWSIAIYEDSLLVTSSNDIVQKDIQTGAIQRTFRAHMKKIYSFVVTTDSRMISSANEDTIIVWSLETGSILRRIWLRSSGIVVHTVFSLNDLVFVGSSDRKVRQIDLLSGKVVRTISTYGAAYCVVAAEDYFFVGKTLSPHILKFNIDSGAVILTIEGHTNSIFSLYIWDGLLYSGSVDEAIIAWNIVNGEIVRSYVGHSGVVNAIEVCNGELYSTSSRGELFKWSINDGLIANKFPEVHFNEIQSFACRSQLLFTGSSDATIIKWDASTGNVTFIYDQGNFRIRSIVSWKKFIISAGEDAEIRKWDASIDSIYPFAVFDNNRTVTNTLLVYDDYVYSGENFGAIKEISLSNLTIIRTFNKPHDEILSLAASKLSLYGGGNSGSLYQWNISSGVQTAERLAHWEKIMSLTLTEDILYSGSYDFIVGVWNANSLDNLNSFYAPNKINAVSIQQESLIVCTLIGLIKFSLVNSGDVLYHEDPAGCFSIITRENIVYTGHEDSLIRSRTLQFLVPLEVFVGHLDIVTALCFDQEFILYSAGFDGTIKKWNFFSRSVAFSFENRNGSVSSLAVYQNQLLVGLKNGRIDFYNNSNALYLSSNEYHRKAVSSLIEFNGSIYSSGFDGNILKFSSAGDGNFTTIYKSDHEPMKDLTLGSFFWVGLQGDTKIVFNHFDLSPELVKVIEFQTPLVCVAATDSVLLAGSKLGIIYAWNLKTLNLEFEFKGHVSPVNDILVTGNRLFSASDDKTMIEWSLETKTSTRTYKRLSASALGHLGPVNSLSYCSDTLFSAGSDLTVRRWNTKTAKHDDVYFGFTKSVTTVLCHNGSVFAGSEDFSVLMFRPSLPQNQDTTVKTTTSISTNNAHKKKVVKLQRVGGTSINFPLTVVSVSVTLVLIIMVTFGYALFKKRAKKIFSPPETTFSNQGTESTQNSTDLQTVVDSVMGISKHAAYLIENSSLAKVKKIASGGGGEIFLAKVMDPSLRKKHGETAVQKIVLVKSKLNEEAFYQEVGIMILLSPFPNFCKIIGYTENPLSMILKNYHHGSLDGWLRKNKCGTRTGLKILKETACALHVMHSHYLAHCDLKPQNILMELENGLPSCYLTDFGITQVLSDKIIATKAFHVISLRGLSVSYAAPEAFRWFRTKLSTRADFKKFDIYSFACIVHELVNKKTPWS